jgi:hypothetical protein
VTSWAAALASPTLALGSSPLFNITAPIGGTFNTPPNLVGLQSFNIAVGPIPEPPTLALAAFGAAVLLISRRQGWISVREKRAGSSTDSHATTNV